MGYESIYPRTAVGAIETKVLPERVALAATAPGDAFADRGAAFRKLFAYIKTHQVAMSVPVQASPSQNEMIFLVGAKDRPRQPRAEGDVDVRTLPAATVASIGLRGSYSRKRYEQGLGKLRAWLAIHPEWQTNAAPYLVYWNSPLTPWFLRRSEIHQPVAPSAAAAATCYAFKAETIDGRQVALADYRGRVLLVVNTASKCGFTPQYDGLEKLYRQLQARGFVVLGFPSNDFLGQEFGSNAEVAQFCKLNYGVTFPMFAKIVVKGEGQHPLYRWLTDPSTNPGSSGAITWNFNKFLIDRTGRVVARFGSKTKPDDPELVRAVEQALVGRP